MDDAKTRDEFERIKLNHELTRFKDMITRYDENRMYYVKEIEKATYRLGRLDERLRAAT